MIKKLHRYTVYLSDKDTGTFTTDMDREEFKNYISNNEWIVLNWVAHKENVDVQTCNIVYIDEWENYHENKEERKIEREKQRKLINKIEKYKFNWRMKWWLNKNLFMVYLEDEEHPYFSLNIDFLKTILDKCESFRCKKVM